MRFLRFALPEGDEGLNEAVVTVDFDELTLLSETLARVLEDLDEWEFDTRMGKTTDEGKVLLSELRSLLDTQKVCRVSQVRTVCDVVGVR